MNDLEIILRDKISNLEKVILDRNTDVTWQIEPYKDGDDNEYHWFHCGEQSNYQGRLEALKEIFRLIGGVQ